MRKRRSQSLKNGARALCEYACDANAAQKTVLVSFKLRQMATVSVSNRKKAQKGKYSASRAKRKALITPGVGNRQAFTHYCDIR
eukprot:2402655-Pleurochrysis_carterae.AAC.1